MTITRITINIDHISELEHDFMNDIETTDGNNPSKAETMWTMDKAKEVLLNHVIEQPHRVTDKPL